MVYLQDMKNTDPGKMTSKIASKACRKYKGDPAIVDKVKDWIVFKYGEELEAELEVQRKVHKKEIETLKEESQMKIEALREENKRQQEESLKREKKLLLEQALHTAEALLSSTNMSISEVARISGIEESEVEVMAKRLIANK